MSEQAIETESEVVFDDGVDEVEETEVVEVEAEAEIEAEAEETEEDGEVEIVAEGEEEPSSKPVRKSGYAKRIDKLRGRVEAAQTETAAEARKREMLEEENKLLRMKLDQGKPKGPPVQDDFDTDADYYAAKSEYDTEQARQAGREEAVELFNRTQSQTTQVAAEKAKEEAMLAHYERVETLNVPDYEKLEDSVIEVMGNNLVTEIIANTDRSHLVIPYLAANPGKAERFAQMSKTQPVKCLLEIGALANSLKVQRKHSPAADPETTIDKGMAANKTGYLKGVRFE